MKREDIIWIGLVIALSLFIGLGICLTTNSLSESKATTGLQGVSTPTPIPLGSLKNPMYIIIQPAK